jgi:hypothetical protein
MDDIVRRMPCSRECSSPLGCFISWTRKILYFLLKQKLLILHLIAEILLLLLVKTKCKEPHKKERLALAQKEP